MDSRKFLSGDIVITGPAVLYMVIYEDQKPGDPVFAGKVWDGKYPEGTVPCVRLRPDFNPDRRFMSVRTKNGVIGQFKVWFLKENEIQLFRRLIGERSGFPAYKTDKEITFERMQKFESMQKKYIYPEVKVLCEVGNHEKNDLSLETYIRLKHRGKYYLYKCYREFEITTGIESQLELISSMKHFYSEIYRYQKLMKVDLKMVMPQPMGPDKPCFELDPDQTSEEERINPKIK